MGARDHGRGMPKQASKCKRRPATFAAVARGHLDRQPPSPAARVAAVAIVVAAAACASRCAPIVPDANQLGVSEVVTTLETCPSAAKALSRVETIVSGLDVPWDVAFLADGRALITERPGRIRVVESNGSLRPEPWASIPVYGPAGAEIGLLGIDTRSGTDGETEVYVTATVQSTTTNPATRFLARVGRWIARVYDPERGHATTLQVIAFNDRAGRGVNPRVVVDGLPSAYLHGGGGLRFGPDGLLYTANGDGAEPPRAQLDSSRRGKILRYAVDGSVPGASPMPASPLFARGVRHVQGLDWLSTGELLAIDHGPTGLPAENHRTGRDELNAVATVGANLGWPVVTGATTGGPFVSPLVTWTPAIAPAGLAVYRGVSAAWSGSVFVAGLKGGLRRVVLDRGPAGMVARCEDVVLNTTYGRLRLVRNAPDGTLWVGTSNRDGRGRPRANDDRILRITPPDLP